MRELLAVCGQHLPAVTRDLIVAGYHLHDIPSKMSWVEFSSFVLSAPPNTAIYDARNEGWSKTDTLIATLIEALTGNANITSRFDRPGVSKEDTDTQRQMALQRAAATASAQRKPNAPKKGGVQFGHRGDAMSITDFKKMYAARNEEWAADQAAKFPDERTTVLSVGGAGGVGVNNG